MALGSGHEGRLSADLDQFEPKESALRIVGMSVGVGFKGTKVPDWRLLVSPSHYTPC